MLRIAIPKGSLELPTLELFAQADLEVKGASRGYNPSIDDPRISQVKILRPQEIPQYVSEGYFDIGISGHDCVAESGADVEEIAEMPYGRQQMGTLKMIIAVPEDSPINSPKDIPTGSRVTTEFPNVTKKYFSELGIDVKIFYSYGATEAKVPELMDVIVDLTETGTTLVKNNLKVIGQILESSTRLIVNKKSWNDPGKKPAIEEIRMLLLGVIEARGRVLLSMNVPREKVETVIDMLPAMKNPTVAPLHDQNYFEVTTVVDKRGVNILIPKLKSAGAEDILEIPITKIIK